MTGELLTGGERRNLSVLVLDLVGSSEMSSRLDPEDYSEFFERLTRIWQPAVHEFDGMVLKWTGDGMIAIFGYPSAHDNDAARAVMAGLRLLELTERARRTDPVPSIRIGIHTGLALVNRVAVGSTLQVDVHGETPALASRVEGLADENSLLITDATAELVSDEFELESLGPRQVKGFDDPIGVHRVVGRREGIVDEPSMSLFGRERELAVLAQAWERVRSGTSGSVLVSAAAGVGKSRLLAEFTRLIRDDGGDVVTFRCSELMRTTAFHPILRHFRSTLEASGKEQTALVTEQLDLVFGDHIVPGGSGLVANALGFPVELDPAIKALDPGRRRELLLKVITDWIVGSASNGPFCVMFEDLHWADPSTLELLAPLMSTEGELPLLVVASSRPEADLGWTATANVELLELGPLDRPSALALVAEMSRGRLSDDLVEGIVDRSDGIPLFITALTGAVATGDVEASGSSENRLATSADDVPTSLRDSLMMRLDKLGTLRELASIAATIGKTFDVGLLAEVGGERDTIDDDLDQIVAAGVLVEVDEGERDRRFTFGHALVREAAYSSITKRTRQQWHGRIATAMQHRGDHVEPEVVAHHLTQAEQFDDAVGWWIVAAQSDFADAAYDESIAHFERGLAIVDRVDAAHAPLHEFPLQLGLGLAYATRFGYMSIEAERAYQRANELTLGLSGPEGFPAVLGLWAYYQVVSDPSNRRQLGERCYELASLTDDPAIRLEGISALSTTLAFEGDTQRALEMLGEGIALGERYRDRDMSFFMPQHPVAGFNGIGASLAWSCGQFDLAQERYERLCEFAEHPTGVIGPFTSGYSHTFAAWYCGLRGDADGVARHASAAMEVANEYGFLVWLGAAAPHLGFASAMAGEPMTGLPTIAGGIAAWRAAGSGLFVSYYEHCLALAYESVGDNSEAMAAVERGIEHSRRHAERFHLAELLRLRGRLHERSGDDGQAETDRRSAIEVAAQQGTAVFEYRALLELEPGGRLDADLARRLDELSRRFDGVEGVLATVDVELTAKESS